MAHKPILVVIAQGVEGSTNLQIKLKLLVVAQGGNSLLKKRGKRIIISYLMIFWFPSHIMQNFFELERPRHFFKQISEVFKILWEVSSYTNTSTWTKYSPQSSHKRQWSPGAIFVLMWLSSVTN